MIRRLVAALLRLAPSDFRGRHAEDVLATHDRRSREMSRGVARVWFGLRELVGAALLVGRLRLGSAGLSRGGFGGASPDRRRSSGGLSCLVSDFRFSARNLAKSWTVSLVAVLSLGLGIAAVTSMLVASDALYLRPLPYDRNGELAFVGTRIEGQGGGASSGSSVPDFLDLRDRTRTMRIAAYRQLPGVNLGGESVEWTSARRVSSNFFDVLNISPLLGRTILPGDVEPGSNEVAVLGHALWERRFGGDPNVLGRVVTIDGVATTVVGVLPAFEFGGLAFGSGGDLWLPLSASSSEPRSARSVNMIARVSDADFTAAREELASLTEALADEWPDTNAGRSFVLAGVRDEWYGAPWFQQGMVGAITSTVLVLLIACANVANLMLARGADRVGEIAVRRALGASRFRVLRQLFVEALLLASAGGLLGLLGSIAGLRGLAVLAASRLPELQGVGLGGRGIGVAVAVALVATVLFGLVPALRTFRGGTHGHLTTRTSTGAAAPGRLRSLLVGAQVALAMVLLASTGVVARSVEVVRSVDTGFDARGALTFSVDFPANRYEDDAALQDALKRVDRELGTLPDVAASGVAVGLPGQDWTSLSYAFPEDPPDDSARARYVVARVSTPGWLAAVGAGDPLRGRALASNDGPGAPAVALVNESFARAHWPDVDPLGRTVRLGGRLTEIVGLMPDLLELGPVFAARPAVYVPLSQWPSRSVEMVVRSASGNPVPLASVRDALRRVDPNVALHDVATLDAVLEGPAERAIVMSSLLYVLSGVAILLAVVGVYASVTYGVSRRVPEIGVRMAVGADRRSVRWMILGNAALVSGIGLLAGLLAASATTRGLSTFLFGVGPLDVEAFLGSAGLLLAVSLAAAWLPARRASAVDPMETLRES